VIVTVVPPTIGPVEGVTMVTVGSKGVTIVNDAAVPDAWAMTVAGSAEVLDGPAVATGKWIRHVRHGHRYEWFTSTPRHSHVTVFPADTGVAATKVEVGGEVLGVATR